jgi:hypothetical protein
MDSAYEKMEEVSLEQLLEGRERPTTFAGTIAIPIEDDVEELGAEELMPIEESPVAVAVMDEPAPQPVAAAGNGRVEALEAEVADLRDQLETVRRQHRIALEALLDDLGQLTDRVRRLTND